MNACCRDRAEQDARAVRGEAGCRGQAVWPRGHRKRRTESEAQAESTERMAVVAAEASEIVRGLLARWPVCGGGNAWTMGCGACPEGRESIGGKENLLIPLSALG